jgi:Cdc6-like AAA superfamily ATPase
MDHLEKGRYLKKIQLIKLNCVGLQTSKLFYQTLLNELDIEHKKSQSLEDTIRMNITRSRKIIIVLDEIDQLCRNVIYNVYSWTTLKRSSLILIGIANDIDLIHSLSLTPRTGASPVLIHFEAYTKSQIQEIILSRLGHDHSDLFDPKAIEFIAGKCATSGDIRKALQLCIRALDTKVPPLLDTNNSSRNIPRVTVKDVAPIISDTMAPKIISTINSLPLTQQLILCCVVKLTQGKEVAIQKAYNQYRQATKILDVGYLSYQEFIDICDILSTTELITTVHRKEKGANGSNDCLKITTHVTQSQILFSVASDSTITNIITNFLNHIHSATED